MPFIGNQPAKVPLTSADITDGIITSAKIANDAVVTGKIADGTIATADLNTGLTVNLGAGAVGTPSLTTSGDTNTGIFFPAADTIAFTEGGTEAMRINSSGQVGIGVSSINYNLQVNGSIGCYDSSANLEVGVNASGWFGNPAIRCKSGFTYLILMNNTGGVGLTNGGTSWTSLSDERYKDIIEPITDAVQKVSTLRAVIGKFKDDEKNVRRSFLIAQDVQAVLPEAVENSNPERLGLQYTEIIPLLVSAIKELKEIKDVQANKIQALEARLTALENN